MITVKHKFLDHQINTETETLIIGTFNPKTTDNDAEFFYGRSRIYLWRLLPTAFGETDLKGATKQKKLEFIRKYKIDFIDLIEEVEEVEEAPVQGINYRDDYIEGRVKKWRNIEKEINNLKKIKRVCITRKTFNDVPNIRKKVEAIKELCIKSEILFKPLISPARYYNQNKQSEWTNFLLNDNR